MNLVYATNVPNLITLSTNLDKGKNSKSWYYKESDLFSKSSFYKTVKLADNLNLIEEPQRGRLTLTERGKRLSSGDVEEVLREGIEDYRVYKKVLKEMEESAQEQFSVKEVSKMLEGFGASDLNERSMDSASKLLMQVLDAANYGQYDSKRGTTNTFTLEAGRNRGAEHSESEETEDGIETSISIVSESQSVKVEKDVTQEELSELISRVVEI